MSVGRGREIGDPRGGGDGCGGGAGLERVGAEKGQLPGDEPRHSDCIRGTHVRLKTRMRQEESGKAAGFLRTNPRGRL